MDNNAQSAKIKELAQTLRKNGLAGSDSEAMRMAETMTTTEDKVNKNFEDKKSTMVKNYDFEKAKQNGATTYGANPSTGIKSQIENAASAIGDPKTTEASAKPVEQAQTPTQEKSENLSHTWEKEEATQEAQPAPVSPSFNGSNGAINNAINNVQERFAQQSAQQVNPELPVGLTLSEAATHEREAERNVPEVEVQQAPVQVAPIEQTPVQEEVAPVEEQAPVAEPEPVQAPVQEEVAPVEHQAVQQEIPQQTQEVAQPAPVVEQSLPTPEIRVEPEQVPAEAPQAVEQNHPPQQPVEQPSAPVEQAAEEEDIVEKTQEMPTNPNPEKDTSKYAEAKIDLADVFNVNNNKRM